VAAAAPHLILYLGYQDQGEQIYDGLLPMFTLTASALLAALVITLLVRARPDWGYGVGGAAIVPFLAPRRGDLYGPTLVAASRRHRLDLCSCTPSWLEWQEHRSHP
jgi:hypothetical protein